MPSGITAGDILLAFVVLPTSTSITWPAGWTGITQATKTGLTIGVAKKVAAGSDTLTFTTALSTESAHITYRAYSNDTTTNVGTLAAGTTGSPDSPTLTNGDSQKYLWIAVGASGAAISGYPSGYTGNQVTENVTNGYIAVATKNSETDSENPAAFSATSGTWYAQTISIDEQVGIEGNFSLITSGAQVFTPTVDHAADATFSLIQSNAQAFTPVGVIYERTKWTTTQKT